MAGNPIHSEGVSIDAKMVRTQSGEGVKAVELSTLRNVRLPRTSPGSRWDIELDAGYVVKISETQGKPSSSARDLECNGCLLAPSLCHAHVHLDKAFLLSHPKYRHLQIERGDFQEAMELTGRAKAMFEEDDLLERGHRLIDESVEAGVTHMRAFVEVDAGVNLKCLNAGLRLQREALHPQPQCVIQLCAFAQLPLFTATSDDENGSIIRDLMQEAAKTEGVGVIGSTPYVEEDRLKSERNIAWMIDLAIEVDMHLDFHLDYTLDHNAGPLVWKVIDLLKQKKWNQETTNKTVVLGHCTRLTLFQPADWQRLRHEIGDLRVSFVGLPTSDLFMMKSPDGVRGTLNVLELVKIYGVNACLGINNIGNAFTPQGSCDPLTLACNGIGLYQASTSKDAELLYECVSTRARAAIGLHQTPLSEFDLGIASKQEASFVLFGQEKVSWRSRQDVQGAVQLYDHNRGRRSILRGNLV